MTASTMNEAFRSHLSSPAPSSSSSTEERIRRSLSPRGGSKLKSRRVPSRKKLMGKLAGKEASRYSNDFDQHSILAAKQSREVTQLRWSDLEIGKLLGRGNFSHVYEVKLRRKQEGKERPSQLQEEQADEQGGGRGVSLEQGDEEEDVWDLISTSSALDSDQHDGDNERPREKVYALKHLHPGVRLNPKDFTASAVDLVLEAKMLGCLDHPNIVKLYGVTEGSLNKVFSSGKGYFLLLDRLQYTLDNKIQEWSSMEALASASLSSSNSSRRSLPPTRLPAPGSGGAVSRRRHSDSIGPSAPLLSPKDRSHSVLERLRAVSVDVARGMEYLHSHNIIFRDLKPSNIGFTRNGRVKIFDFGLAREVVDPSRKLTRNTGSLRYMAPEVHQGTRYGFSADVYSFGVLLWELCTMHKPFKGMSVEEHSELVMVKGYRPKISAVAGSDELRALIQGCWEADPAERPSFRQVRKALVVQLKQADRRNDNNNSGNNSSNSNSSSNNNNSGKKKQIKEEEEEEESNTGVAAIPLRLRLTRQQQRRQRGRRGSAKGK